MAERTAWKLVRPDGRTKHDFVWPLTPGAVVRSDQDADPENHGSCPQHPGDGLSVALTAKGLSLASFASSTLLKVAFDDADVGGEDEHKVRVIGPVTVLELIDWHRAIREGTNPLPDLRVANLAGAALRGAKLCRESLDEANLEWSNLTAANLNEAFLARACLDGANLRRAHLVGALLVGASLDKANLRGANLDGANLGRAFLRNADLSRARLRGTNLDGAFLDGALLDGAGLDGAFLGDWERGPDGYARLKDA